MIRLFIKDQISWILFFVILLLWMNLLFYLDAGFEGISIAYLNMTSIGLFIVFVIFRLVIWHLQFKNQAILHFEGNSLFDLYNREFEKLLEQTKQKENLMSVQFQEQADEQVMWIHEMKTPLTAQRLMIDALPPSKKKQELDLEWIRMNFLLDQTLHTLRMQTLEKDLILQQLLLRELCIKEIRSLQSWFLEKDLEIDMDDVTHEVHSDAKWLQFILRQILSNAIKYSPNGCSIEIMSKQTADQRVYLEIRDHGVGISKEDLPRLYQRGFTGSFGRKQSASTGMGLYLSKNIADRLKINIQVTSELNEGTTVKLFFPIPNKMDEIHTV